MDYFWVLLVFSLVSSALAESCSNCGGNAPCQCVSAGSCRLAMDVLKECDNKLFCCPEADKYQSLRKLFYIAESWVNYPAERRTTTSTTTTIPPPPPETAPDDDVCGIRMLDPNRISVGTEVELGEYPWIVALRYQSRNNDSDVRIMCGGSLITRQHVLTAAHCVVYVKDPDTGVQFDLMGVVAGEHDTSSEIDCKMVDGKEICSSSVYVPVVEEPFIPTNLNRFVPRTLKNDIAVVKLQSEVPITDFIRPICLPSADQQLATGDSVLIAGWGITLKSSSPRVLRHDFIDVTDFDSCVKTYKDRDRRVYSRLMFCAGRDDVHSCIEDSGGPVMHVTDGRFYVMGLVSFYPDGYCGLKGVPGVYTNVTNYLNFIKNSISS